MEENLWWTWQRRGRIDRAIPLRKRVNMANPGKVNNDWRLGGLRIGRTGRAEQSTRPRRQSWERLVEWQSTTRRDRHQGRRPVQVSSLQPAARPICSPRLQKPKLFSSILSFPPTISVHQQPPNLRILTKRRQEGYSFALLPFLSSRLLFQGTRARGFFLSSFRSVSEGCMRRFSRVCKSRQSGL